MRVFLIRRIYRTKITARQKTDEIDICFNGRPRESPRGASHPAVPCGKIWQRTYGVTAIETHVYRSRPFFAVRLFSCGCAKLDLNVWSQDIEQHRFKYITLCACGYSLYRSVIRVVCMFQISGNSHKNFRSCRACNICKTAKKQLF